MSYGSEKISIYLGGGGVKTFTTSPTTANGLWKAIYFLRDSQLDSVIAADIAGATNIDANTTFMTGAVIQGTITKVTTNNGAMFLVS